MSMDENIEKMKSRTIEIIDNHIKDKVVILADYTKLTWQQRKAVRNQYIKLQNNKCFYCNEDLDKDPPKRILDKKIEWYRFPPNFLKYPIHLQHNHVTGMTEGAVHSYCNAVMWQYEGK